MRNKSNQVLADKKPPCKCENRSWTTTENTISEVTSFTINDVPYKEYSYKDDVEDEVTDDVEDEVTEVVVAGNNDAILTDITLDKFTNESIHSEKPKIGNLTKTDAKQNETENNNHLVSENDNDPDYDYIPDSKSALHQLISHVYPNNSKNKVPYKPPTKQVESVKKLKYNVKEQTNKLVNTMTKKISKKVSKQAINRAMKGTVKAVIDNTNRQKPLKKAGAIRNSGTKTKLRNPPIKPTDKLRLKIQYERSEDQPFYNSGLNTNHATADEVYKDASELETKIKSLESVPFIILIF